MKHKLIVDSCKDTYIQIDDIRIGDDLNTIKFPYVDIYGDLWLDKYTLIYKDEDDYHESYQRPATEEEEKLYWRYHKAWKLMNK